MNQELIKPNAEVKEVVPLATIPGPAIDRAALERHADFMWKSIKETANLLLKASSFFLAIIAAILSYAFAHALTPSLRVTAFCVVISVTVLFIVAVGFVSWGLFTGLKDLEAAQELLCPHTFARLGLKRYFSRTRLIFWIVAIATTVILAIMVAAMGRSIFS